MVVSFAFRRALCVAAFLSSTLSASAIQAVMSRTLFYRQEGGSYTPLLELYWQVDARSLAYRRAADSALTARYATSVRIFSDTGVVRRERYIIATPARPAATVRQQSLLDVYRTPLPPGRYRAEVALAEEGFPDRTAVLIDSFRIEEPVTTAYLSEVQILDTFYRATQPDPFTKDDTRLVPLCADFLDDGRNNLHFFFEAYGLEKLDTSRYPLRLRTYVAKRAQDPPLHYLNRSDTLRSATADIPPQSFDIAPLPSGNYMLTAALEDRAGAAVAVSRRRFQRLNTAPTEPPKVADADTATAGVYLNLATTFLGKYNAQQVRAMLKMALPIADPPERAAIQILLGKPDDVYSRYFIYNFFHRRNPEKPDAAWKAHADRVREVNKLFGGVGKPGYETDRGTIFLKYGAPSERIPVRAESGALPYEVWVYEVLPRTARTSYFLFYQPPELVADYRLLTSTVPDETRNDAWRTFLYPGGASAGGLRPSRAEQYFGNR